MANRPFQALSAMGNRAIVDMDFSSDDSNQVRRAWQYFSHTSEIQEPTLILPTTLTPWAPTKLMDAYKRASFDLAGHIPIFLSHFDINKVISELNNITITDHSDMMDEDNDPEKLT